MVVLREPAHSECRDVTARTGFTSTSLSAPAGGRVIHPGPRRVGRHAASRSNWSQNPGAAWGTRFLGRRSHRLVLFRSPLFSCCEVFVALSWCRVEIPERFSSSSLPPSFARGASQHFCPTRRARSGRVPAIPRCTVPAPMAGQRAVAPPECPEAFRGEGPDALRPAEYNARCCARPPAARRGRPSRPRRREPCPRSFYPLFCWRLSCSFPLLSPRPHRPPPRRRHVVLAGQHAAAGARCSWCCTSS